LLPHLENTLNQKDPNGLLELLQADSLGETTDGAKDDTTAEQPTNDGGIAGVAIGCGIDDPNDVDELCVFLESLLKCSSVDGSTKPKLPPMECLQPNAEYATMKDELTAYRNLSSDEKEQLTQAGTMGPAKMAKFVEDFTKRIVQIRQKELRKPPLDYIIHAKNKSKTATKGLLAIAEALDSRSSPISSGSKMPQATPVPFLVYKTAA